MMKTGFSKKFWAFLIALLMLITTFPLTALAEGEAQEPADTSQPTETTQPEDSPQPVDSPQPEETQQSVDTSQPAEAPLLSGLSVKYGDAELLAEFSADNFGYSIDAGAEADKVVIAATPATEGDLVEGVGEHELNIGENVFTVTVSRTVEGSDPLKQEYVITINRAAQALSGDCSLASLKVKAGETEITLDPAFSPAVTEYKTAADAGPVVIEAAASGLGAKVEGRGEHVLVAGDNKLTVTVTAADGTKKEYNITITTPSGISAQAISGNYEYSISSTLPHTATIISYNGSEEYITTPTTLGGYPVTAIGDSAFSDNEDILGVTISEGVKSIGYDAFYYNFSLDTVNLPESLETIESMAFSETGITEINLPEKVNELGAGVFSFCFDLESITVDPLNLTYSAEDGVLFDYDKAKLVQYPSGKSGNSYTIPGTVTEINSFAFSGSGLRGVTIPDTVRYIRSQAFTNCWNLYSVEIPDSVESLDDSFNWCDNLTEVVFLGSCPAASETEFDGCNGLTIYYVTGQTGFPADNWNGFPVTAFDPETAYSFAYSANGADSGSAPAGGTYMYGTAVTIPDKGDLAKQLSTFEGWNTMSSGSGADYAPGDNYRMGPHDTTLYANWQVEHLLKSLKVYYDYEFELPLTPAFSPDVYNYTLEVSGTIDEIEISAEALNEDDWTDGDYYYSLDAGENVIEIQLYSMDYDLLATYTVTITRSAATDEKTFGYYKYEDEGTYIQITRYTGKEAHAIVPDYIDNKPVAKIGMKAFFDNQYIQSVTIQDGVIDIEPAAFMYCFNLKSVTLPETLKNIGSHAFFNCLRLNSIGLPGSLISIGPSAFSYCYLLTGFTIPDNVAGIGEPFLAGCEGIETISIGLNPNFTVEDGVLFNAGKTRLIKYPAKKSSASYNIPLTVTDIDEAAFDSAQVGSVTIPEGVTYLDYNTFTDCENLYSVSLPDSLEYIQGWAFNNCTSLESIELPKNLYDITGYVFEGCTGLTSVSVDAENEYYTSMDGVLYCYGSYYDENSDEDIEAYRLAYYPAGRETSFTIPPSVMSINYCAFIDSRLKQIDIGSGVMWIDSGAFRDCDNLTSVTIPNNVEEISGWAFEDCDNLCTVTIGDGAYYVDLNAFENCPKLAAVYFLGDAPETEYDYEDYGVKYSKSIKKFKSDLEHAPLELQQRYSGMVKTQGTVTAQATAKLFRGCSSSLIVYKASGTHGYTNPWHGRPVKTFYPSQTCTVKFSLNGKTGDPVADQTVYKYGKAAKPIDPESAGVRFVGWYKEPSGVTAWNFESYTVSANITLYAKWTNRSVITAKPNSKYYGTVEGSDTYDDGETVTLTAKPKPGYRFLYWTESVSGNNITVPTDAVYTFLAAGSRTLTARFAAIGKPTITSISSPKYSSVSLTWSEVEGAAGYNVYRATSSTGTYTWIKDNMNERAFTDTGLKWGKTYYYKVNAYFVCSTATTQGAKSSYKSIKPTWPKLTLAASSDHNYGIELSWDPVENADCYYVYFSTYDGSYKTVGEKVYGISYLFKTDLKKTFYFKAQPVDEIEGSDDIVGPLSAYAKGKEAWTPIKLTASPKTYERIELTWNAVTDATSYDVLRCDTYNGEYAAISAATGLTALSYTDTGLTEGKTYYYKLTAHDDGSSITSGYKYAKPAWPTVSLKAASNTYNSIKLTWNKTAGATAYDVLRYNSVTTSYERIAGDPADLDFTVDGYISYTDTGLSTGVKRYYKIKAYDGGNYKMSDSKYATPVWPTVSLKAASNTYNSILLTWKPVAGATAYDVLRCSTYNGKYAVIPAATGLTLTTFSYTDTGLTLGKTYYYKLRAYDGANSKTSSYKYAKPAWPTLKLTAKSDSYNSIKLTWNEINGVTRYEILRGTSYTKITTSLGDTTNLFLVDSGTAGLTPGKTYYYKVRPVDGDNSVNGPYCSYKYAKPVPSAPDVTLSNSVSGGIIGTWSAVDGASGYEVYRATSKSGTYSKLITTMGFSFWDVSAAPGRTYYYKVRAYSLVGTTKVYGAYSAVEYLTD